MSVLIKGMKMPPACNRCWNCDINTVDGTETEPPYACLIRMKFVEEEWEHKRPKWCPLVEVLPHGRLIDADALKEKKKHSNEFAENIVAVAEIDWMPTVIEAEVET